MNTNCDQVLGKTITSEKVMDYALGKITPRGNLQEEFQKYNDVIKALLGKGYAKGNLERLTVTKNHLIAFNINPTLVRDMI